MSCPTNAEPNPQLQYFNFKPVALAVSDRAHAHRRAHIERQLVNVIILLLHGC